MMKRRQFIGSALTASLACSTGYSFASPKSKASRQPLPSKELKRKVSALREDVHQQLFNGYLPFWERGGIDDEYGGFMCYLYDDGTVQNEQKDIWYQGRGIWVYASLYNEIDPDSKWLEIAQRARDFMVTHMHNGDGTWTDTVDRRGNRVEGMATQRSNNIYGALFAALGLIQYARATGSEKDLELAKLSIRKSIERYEHPEYAGVSAPGITEKGLRTQGCSFMFTWLVPQLLERDADPWFESVAKEHQHILAHKYWNDEYGISNEILYHDHSRIPSLAASMVPGHSIEAQWMGMEAAHRDDNIELRDIFKERMRRLIEMSWDYVFDGTCDTNYEVFPRDGNSAGPALDTKTMWAQTEVTIGCLLAYQYAREDWAWEWFERSWRFLQRTMTTDHGVWRQAVNRVGADKQRDGISIYRKGNFHQPRCLMMLSSILKQISAD